MRLFGKNPDAPQTGAIVLAEAGKKRRDHDVGMANDDKRRQYHAGREKANDEHNAAQYRHEEPRMAKVQYVPPGKQLSTAVQEGVRTGWSKNDLPEKRHTVVLEAHKGDALAAGRSMQALANLTTDNETRHRARADAVYFLSKHRRETQMGAGIVRSGKRQHIR